MLVIAVGLLGEEREGGFTYHDPCMVTHAAVPFGLNLISRGAM